MSVAVASGAVRRRGGAAQSALPAAVAGRAGLGDLLQLHQAVHLVAAPRARARARDRAGGRIPRGDRRSGASRGGCCSLIALAVATWVAGLRHLLRAAGRAVRPRRKGSGALSCGWASSQASCWPSCSTGSRSLRSRCSAAAPGSELVLCRRRCRGGDSGLRAPARPAGRSLLDSNAAFFTMNGVMSVTVFAFALMDRLL